MRIYIAGPLSGATTLEERANVSVAVGVANQLANLGHYPYCPHLSLYWHIEHPRPYDFWLRLGQEWLRQCQALYFIAPSPGTDKELAMAKQLKLYIFHSMEDVVAHGDKVRMWM